MGNIARWATLLAACLLAWPATAEPTQIGEIATGYVYYNRPGASLADHNADLAACMRDIDAAHVPLADPGTAGIGPAAPVGQLIFHLIWDGPLAGVVASKVENCMIVRRWRAVRLSDEEGAQLAALPTADLAARLTPWIGDPAPHGEIVRSFSNVAAHPVDFEIASRPARADTRQLSLKLYAAAPPPPADGVDTPPVVVAAKLDPRWPTPSLKPGELTLTPPEGGVILVRIRGIGPKGGGGMSFSRLAPSAGGAAATVDDHAPGYAVAAIGWIYAKREGNWFAFAVPAGQWRISGSGFLSYCLGAPSFAVGAGEVVYAGTFDLAGQSIGPDLDLEPAKAYLAGAPAANLRPAVYQNGARGSCRGFGVIYALEIPGAPFDPDYAWGGAPGR